MIRQAIILSGGFGTRLQSVVNDRPKPMAEVNGKPFIEYLFEQLLHFGVNRVVLALGYKAEFIQQHYQNKFKSLDLIYSVEEDALGTGGATLLASQHIQSSDCYVLNGDSFFGCDLKQLYAHHVALKAKATLSLKAMKNFERYGCVVFNEKEEILAFKEKQFTENGFINAGVYCLNLTDFKSHHWPKKFSLEKDFFEAKLKESRFAAFPSDAYFIDIGIPDDFKRANLEHHELEIR